MATSSNKANTNAAKSVPVAQPTMTTAQATAIMNNRIAELEQRRKEIGNAYKRENKVSVTGSPMYKPYFGNNMPISINGILIHVPLDGRPWKIPESFAEVFLSRIRSVDEDILMKKNLSNVSENVESYVGERDLINRG